MPADRKKLVICGDGACGKTCLLMMYLNSEFPEYVPTVFETYVTDIPNFELKDKKTGKIVKTTNIELSLWDTAGQEDYDRLRPLSYPDTDVILISFAINSPTSLANVADKWVPEIKHYCPKTPFLLIGNMVDLRNDSDTISELKRNNEQPVSKSQGEDMAKQVGAIGYLECSALTQEGIGEVIQEACWASYQSLEDEGKKNKFCGFL